MLLLLKLAVPPVLVAAISLAARLWGPTVGALLMGLPWLTGPVLFFLTLDKGDGLRRRRLRRHRARRRVHLRLPAGLWRDERRSRRWPVCLAAAAAAFAATAWATQGVDVALVTAAGACRGRA